MILRLIMFLSQYLAKTEVIDSKNYSSELKYAEGNVVRQICLQFRRNSRVKD